MFLRNVLRKRFLSPHKCTQKVFPTENKNKQTIPSRSSGIDCSERFSSLSNFLFSSCFQNIMISKRTIFFFFYCTDSAKNKMESMVISKRNITIVFAYSQKYCFHNIIRRPVTGCRLEFCLAQVNNIIFLICVVSQLTN